PGVLEEEPLLRIEELGLARGQAEEGGVEEVDAVEDRGGLDQARIGQQGEIGAGGAQLLVREEGDRLGSLAQVAPELLDGRRAGEAAGETDDRHAGGGVLAGLSQGRLPPAVYAPGFAVAARLRGAGRRGRCCARSLRSAPVPRSSSGPER